MPKYRNIAHYLAGILTALSCEVNWVLPIVGAILFLAYEVDEDWHISDEAFHDILEFMIGFFVCVAGLIIWRVFL